MFTGTQFSYPDKPDHSHSGELQPLGAVTVKRTEKYDCMLFDIGGVLFELCGALKILEWMDDKASHEEISNLIK